MRSWEICIGLMMFLGGKSNQEYKPFPSEVQCYRNLSDGLRVQTEHYGQEGTLIALRGKRSWSRGGDPGKMGGPRGYGVGLVLTQCEVWLGTLRSSPFGLAGGWL